MRFCLSAFPWKTFWHCFRLFCLKEKLFLLLIKQDFSLLSLKPFSLFCFHFSGSILVYYFNISGLNLEDIPVLPRQINGILDAPMSVFVGVNANYLESHIYSVPEVCCKMYLTHAFRFVSSISKKTLLTYLKRILFLSFQQVLWRSWWTNLKLLHT